MKLLVKIGSSLLYVVGMLFSHQALADLKAGDMAPEFRLTDQHLQTVSLKDFRGQWVVLYFYPKNDTPGCTTEACSFRDNINRLIQQDAVVLGVSVDSVESHKDFAQKYKLPFSLLADEGGKVADQYDAVLNLGLVQFAKRHSFIIDPEGKIAKVYRDVSPRSHVREVLEELKQLKQQQ